MGRTQDALQICGHQDCAEALMTSEMFLTVLNHSGTAAFQGIFSGFFSLEGMNRHLKNHRGSDKPFLGEAPTPVMFGSGG